MNFTILIQKTVVMISMREPLSKRGWDCIHSTDSLLAGLRIYIIMEILGFREHFCLNVWNIIKPAEYKKFVIVHSVQAAESEQ